MAVKVRFLVYNIYGIGGTVRTVCNFASYLQGTKKYDVEIVSVRRTGSLPMLELHPEVRISALQDARKSAVYNDEEKKLLSRPSEMISPAEDLYPMFSAYTDMRLKEFFSSIHDGVLVTTIPSFNQLSATMVESNVLRIGMEHKSYADHSPEIQKIIRESYGGLDVLTILTERNRHIYRNLLGKDLPIYVLSNGTKRLDFRASLKNPVIIAAGRYSPEKGYDMLIRAFEKVADRFPEWLLKIYGNGKLVNDYVELIKKYHLENRIFLEPATKEIIEKLSEAAFQVCSSHRESFGMSIIEGFSIGVPCVSFACDGPSEIISHEEDGLLVQKEDVDGLAEAMGRMMSAYEFRMELGRNAYEAVRRYDLKKIGNDLDCIIMEHQNQITSSDEYVIYGAGDEGRKAYKRYRSKYNITSFVDMDVMKHGKDLMGIPVNSPEYLAEHTNAKILLAVRRNKGIREYLQGLGVKDIQECVEK